MKGNHLLIVYIILVFIIVLQGCESKSEFKALTSNQHATAINDQTSETLLVYYPYEQIIQHKSAFKSPIAKDIFHIKEERYLGDYSPAVFEIQKKKYLKAHPDLLEYLQLLIWKGKEINKSEDDIQKVIQAIKTNKKKSHKDILQLHYLISILDNVFSQRNQIPKTLASLFYFLQVLETHPLKDDLTLLKDKTHSLIINTMAQENDEAEYAEVINHLIASISDKYKNSFGGYMLRSYIAEAQQQDSSFYNYLLAADKVAISPQEKNLIHFNWGYYYGLQEDSVQHFHLQKAIESLDASSCSINKFYPVIYGLMGSTTEAQIKYYQSKISLADHCPQLIKDKISFVMFNYLEPSFLGLSHQQQVDTLVSITRLAETLFPGKSTLHLQDYYISMLERLLAIMENTGHKGDHLEVLLNETLNTRLKEKYRKTLSNTPTSQHVSINNLLNEINNFKKLTPIDDPVYEDLFFAFLEEDKHPVEDFAYKAISASSLKAKLKKEQSSLVNTVRCFDKYYAYILDDNELNVLSFPSVEFDSLAGIWISHIKQKKDTKTIKSELRALLPAELLSLQNENIAIVSDGHFTLIPIDQLFNKDKIYSYESVLDYLQEETRISINADNINLFSYSNSNTINDREIKEIPELNSSYEECQSIQKHLKSKTLISGYDFTADVVFSDSSVDLTHISSHAYSNPSNRLDNYIIVRAKGPSGNKKIYGYELALQKHIPKVVVLSACETGIGKYDHGAGVQTLSRSLLDNGASTVISTLWKVNDLATSALMQSMYRHWSTGINLYDALALAKQDLITDPQYQHPYYWAGFVLEGNPEVYLNVE